MSKNERLHFISLIQVIGMLLIVLSHSFSKYAEYPGFLLSAVQASQYAGLAAFMWCSGYLLVYTNAIERRGYPSYLVKRARRLLIPYVLIQVIIFVPKALLQKYMGGGEPTGLLHSFLWPREGVLPHFWFCRH